MAARPCAGSTTPPAHPLSGAEVVTNAVAILIHKVVTYAIAICVNKATPTAHPLPGDRAVPNAVAICVNEATSTAHPLVGAQTVTHTVAILVHEVIAHTVAICVDEAGPLVGRRRCGHIVKKTQGGTSRHRTRIVLQ